MPEAIAAAPHTQAGLDASWAALGQPGGWLDAETRLAVARETRVARECELCRERKAALSPYAVRGDHEAGSPALSTPLTTPLTAAMTDAIHRIATDPGRLSQQWMDEVSAAGLEPEELVEITSVVAVVTIADSLSRALSQPERALPSPTPTPTAIGGKPLRERLEGLVLERGWVPMVDPERAEGFIQQMYKGVEDAAGFVFNVARALTSVPEAQRDFFGAFYPNYSTHGPVRPGGLDRAQVELLASSTSAYNDCFY